MKELRIQPVTFSWRQPQMSVEFESDPNIGFIQVIPLLVTQPVDKPPTLGSKQAHAKLIIRNILIKRKAYSR